MPDWASRPPPNWLPSQPAWVRQWAGFRVCSRPPQKKPRRQLNGKTGSVSSRKATANGTLLANGDSPWPLENKTGDGDTRTRESLLVLQRVQNPRHETLGIAGHKRPDQQFAEIADLHRSDREDGADRQRFTGRFDRLGEQREQIAREQAILRRVG